MSVTVQQIYDQVCFVMYENGGFVLGVYTQARFLADFAVVMLDFAQRAPLDKKIFTEMVNAGYAEFIVPDDIMVPQLCFIGGKLIEKTTEEDLMRGHYQWRRTNGTPQQWHEDNLEPKRLEVFPNPDYNGTNIPGSTPPIGKYDDFYPTERNLTMVGPSAPSTTTWALGDTITGVPDSFTPYLVYGVLEKIFSADGETRDVQRAAYCKARWEEAASLAAAMMKEDLMDDEED